jgi:hypothetical protein
MKHLILVVGIPGTDEKVYAVSHKCLCRVGEDEVEVWEYQGMFTEFPTDIQDQMFNTKESWPSPQMLREGWLNQ